MPDEKIWKRPVDYSAGLLIFSLVPGDERVALVLNKRSMEVQVVPKEFLKNPRILAALVEERETDAIISFVQPDGFGSPFGKEEPEDGKNRVVTAAREAMEETGSSLDGRIIESVFYTERPNYWSPYSNTVFAANGVEFEFHPEKILDEFVDPKRSGMWELRKLPIPRRRRREEKRKNERPLVGIYHAALRRSIAILLQLKKNHLAEMGRPGVENADDLARIVINQMPYGVLFSPRTLKMLSGLGRLDLAVERLKTEKEIIYNEELVASVGANMILWLPYRPGDPAGLLNQSLQALVERCDPHVQASMGAFLVDRLERRAKAYLVSLDKDTGLADSDDKQIVVADDDELEQKKNEQDRLLEEAIREKGD